MIANQPAIARQAVVCLLIGLLFGCSPAGNQATNLSKPDQTSTTNPQNNWFREAASDLELVFEHRSGHRERPLFPEIMGGGVALLDIEQDGDLDVYFVQSGSFYEDETGKYANQLFENRGDGKFVNVTADSGCGDTGYGMGVAAADYDNDGDVDLFVTNVGPNVMLQNDGQGHFRDVTDFCHLGDAGWGTSAAFFDADRDGDLDLYVCNYVSWDLEGDIPCTSRSGKPDYCNPLSYNPQVDRFYENNGDGTFTDKTHVSGMGSGAGNGLGVVCGDFNGDDLFDVFVANDQLKNNFWINRGDGRFEDQAMLAGCAVDRNGKSKAGMGTCAADIDGDFDLDLLVVNLQSQSDSFFSNQGQYFIDQTAQVGLGNATRPFTRFGVGFADFDNDGIWDLFQANGRVTTPEELTGKDPFAEPNLLLRGTGDGRFEKIAKLGNATSRAAAFGDLNNDGKVDIVVVNRDGVAEVLINECDSAGNWLMVRALEHSGGDAVGAILRVEVGEKVIRRDINPHYSYLASNDPRAHVGLGTQNQVDAIVVRWVDGTQERFGPFAANQIVVIRRGKGESGGSQ